MYLSRHAKEVQIVVRRDGPRDTMQYLIDQIAKTPNIRLLARPKSNESRRGSERVAQIAR
jgi:thioredoxin reductase